MEKTSTESTSEVEFKPLTRHPVNIFISLTIAFYLNIAFVQDFALQQLFTIIIYSLFFTILGDIKAQRWYHIGKFSVLQVYLDALRETEERRKQMMEEFSKQAEKEIHRQETSQNVIQ